MSITMRCWRIDYPCGTIVFCSDWELVPYHIELAKRDGVVIRLRGLPESHNKPRTDEADWVALADNGEVAATEPK